MLTTTIRTLRLTLLACAASSFASLTAQMPIAPAVSTSPVAVPHNETYGAPWQSAVSNRGDFVLFDFQSGGIYEYPANGGPEITISAPGAEIGGYTDSGVAIDPRNNNLYTNYNYNGGLLEFPFDTKTGMWDLAPVGVANNLQGTVSTYCGSYYQSAGLSINNNGVIAVATENGCGVEIFTSQIDASGNFGPATLVVNNLAIRAKTVSIDDAGNIAFNEDSGGKTGLFFIPAGMSNLNTEAGLQNYFSDTTTYNVQGVAVDTAGNLFVSDANVGLMYIPLVTGSPDLTQSVKLSSLSAAGGPAVDSQRGTIFMPIYGSSGAIKDVAKIYVNRVEMGSTAANTAKAVTGNIVYTFASNATPASFTLATSGTAGGFQIVDVSKCGITATIDAQGNTTAKTTTYGPNGTAGGSTCTLPVSFQPTAVGELSAMVRMLDASGNVLNTTVLHGTGTGSEAAVLPGSESTRGSGFKSPSEIAVDAAGDLFVADSALGQVLEYAAGSTKAVSVGKNLVAPTGVAVDASGNLFVADSGSVIEIPSYPVETEPPPPSYAPAPPTGLNTAAQTTIKSGLGTNLKLACDAIGDVFVSDPDNKRVVGLRNFVVGPVTETDFTGYAQITAIAADGAGNLYIANGPNLTVTSPGASTPITSLSGVTGLAVDISGAVYITSANQTVRVPSVGGVLNPSAETVIAPSATKPTSVAVDLLGNAYVADAGAENIDVVSVNDSVVFGTLATTASTATSSVTLVDDGNQPLNITGFSSTPDFSVTSTTCVGASIVVGSSCSATLTFSPGPGDQGAITGQITASSDAFNTPVAINLAGTGAALAASKTAMTITNPSVTGTSVTVSVTPSTGTSPAPTGNVTLTVTATGYPAVVLTQPLVNGSVTFSETGIAAGSDTFTANYGGDRVYGKSTATSTSTVAPGTVTLVQPVASAVPAYVLAGGTGSAEPFDGSQVPYEYTYTMTVVTTNGAPLVGVPIYNSNGGLTGYNYGSVNFSTSGCAPVPVAADGTVQFAADCVGIDQSNTAIVNITTPYTIAPVYSSPNYTTVTGSSFSFTALRNPSITITAKPGSVSVAAGSTVSTTLTLTSLLGYGVTGVNGSINGQNYSLPVSLDCTNLPAHATCSFSYPNPDSADPNSTDVTPTTPGTVVVTINTNVAVGTTTSSLRSSTTIFSAVCGFGLAGLALARRRRAFGPLACVLLMGGALCGLTSCSTTNINPTPQLATPKGTYPVVITAKQTGSKQVPAPSGGGTQTVYGNGEQISLYFTMNVTVQ